MSELKVNNKESKVAGFFNNLFDKKYKVIVEDRVLTTDKGLDVQLRSTTSFNNEKGMELEIITYILDKYNPEPSPKSQGAMIIGEFFKKYQGGASQFSYLNGKTRPYTKGRGEYALDIIEVESNYKNKGIGTLSYDLSEYLFAKYLMDRNIKYGFVNGVFAPLDADKYFETEKFYYKKGFDILPARDEIYTRRTLLYKPIDTEHILEDKSNRKFEKVEQSREFME